MLGVVGPEGVPADAPMSVACHLPAGQAAPLPAAPQYWKVMAVAALAPVWTLGMFRKLAGHAKVQPPVPSCCKVTTISSPALKFPEIVLLVTFWLSSMKKSVTVNAAVLEEVTK